MREIKHLMKDMNCNIEEACEKIKKAYRLREENRAVADWQRDMAKAHMEFNTKAHEIATKMITDIATMHKDSPMTAGMVAVYKDWHADLVAKAAEVTAMISAYKQEFHAAINMIYSDDVAVAKKFGVDKPEYYACCAKAWLEDKDAKSHKLMRYKECIVK